MRRFALVATAVAAAFAALVPASGAQTLTNCSTLGQNRYVHDVMRTFYYWDTQLPTINVTSYSSPEQVLEALRYMPLDSHFSYIGARQAEEAFYSDSQFIGFGFSHEYDGLGLRMLQVFPDSPASDVGLRRGDRITWIAQQRVTTLLMAGGLAAALGPSTEGVTVEIRYERPDGTSVDATMVKRPVTIPTVSVLEVNEVDGKKVGYLFFRNFVTPSHAALDEAFGALREAGATELVLDLRYNGGGLVAVAQHLASLIGGRRTEGQVFAEYFHNTRNAFRNEITRFDVREHALPLDRIVVITTGASASASELVINALRPFIPVVTVGQATYGKPVGQYGFTMCDQVVYPVAFSLRNALGQGDFFGGIAADCPALDDPAHQLGDPEEASLAEALTVVRTGACSPVPEETAAGTLERTRRARVADELPRPRGFDLLVGAH
ncbi:MAG: PDZ domain-containing protein [Acidobacteria bacterium]|nr:PDZ domain-containing protein [Acidobacteriota bacterium]